MTIIYDTKLNRRYEVEYLVGSAYGPIWNSGGRFFDRDKAVRRAESLASYYWVRQARVVDHGESK